MGTKTTSLLQGISLIFLGLAIILTQHKVEVAEKQIDALQKATLQLQKIQAIKTDTIYLDAFENHSQIK